MLSRLWTVVHPALIFICTVATLSLLTGLVVPVSAGAQTVIYVHDDASGAADGSQGEPYSSLHEALSEAANTSGPVEIRVAGGVYYPDDGPNIPDGKVDTSFGLSGDLAVKGGYTSDFSSRDAEANVTVLSGDVDQDDTTNENGVVTDTAGVIGTNSTHVLRAQQISGTATLDGLTITAGQANVSSQSDDLGLDEGLYGGGLISRSSDVVLSNVTVRGNYTSGDTGGGGGLFSTEAGDFGVEPGSLAVKNSTLRGNAARRGGAVHAEDGPLVLRSTTVRNNQARSDGGGVVSSNRTELTDVTFRNNSSMSGDGGGFFLSSFVEVTVRFETVSFEANTAGGTGGGAYVAVSPGPQFIDVTFRDNSVQATSAGGLYVNAFGGGGGLLRGGTFKNNTVEGSGGEGGAMVCVRCTLNITNTTFRNNSSGSNGGAVVASGGVTFDGVLFENNSTGADGGALDIAGGGPTRWVLRDVVFRGNTSDGDGSGDTTGGGAVAASTSPFASSGVDGRLRNVRFVNNESGEDGGAMMITRGGEYELQDVDFIDNVTGGDFAGEGAALVTEDATANLVNAEVRGNNGPGGVIEVKGDASDKGTNRLTNVVLADNGTETAGSGVVRNSGGIAILNNVVVASNSGTGLVNRSLAGSSTMTVHNSIVYDNNGGLGVYEINNGENGTIDVQNTLVRGGLTGEHVNNEGTINDNGGNITGDPVFADPSNGDYHLQSGSPAVDAGDDSLIPDDSLDLDADGDSSEAVPYDLDRRARTNNTVDLGPYERGGSAPQFTASLSSGTSDAGLPDRFGADLTFQTLSTSTDLTVTYDGSASTEGLGLPGTQGLAVTSLWNIELDPDPSSSDIDATLCFDIQDLSFPVVDRSALNVYARSGPSATDWQERTSTELRPSAENPEQICATGQSSFSQFAVTAKESELPVELVAFEAQIQDEAVRLAWQTASETNNAGFEIQHRAKKAASWEEVGFVDGAGTTTAAQRYRYSVDTELAPGTHRFRLRQVDTDGTAHLSEPVTVELQMDQPVRLAAPAPNPVTTRATVSFAVKEAKETTIRLYNVLGQRVATLYRGTPAAEEAQTVDLAASDLSSGVYFVRLRAGGQTRTQKITVVR